MLGKVSVPVQRVHIGQLVPPQFLPEALPIDMMRNYSSYLVDRIYREWSVCPDNSWMHLVLSLHARTLPAVRNRSPIRGPLLPDLNEG